MLTITVILLAVFLWYSMQINDYAMTMLILFDLVACGLLINFPVVT